MFYFLKEKVEELWSSVRVHIQQNIITAARLHITYKNTICQ